VALHILSLSDANNLYSVSERIVAVESLVFLGEQYKLLHSYLNTLLTSDTSSYSLQQFYNQVQITIFLTVFNIETQLHNIKLIFWNYQFVTKIIY